MVSRHRLNCHSHQLNCILLICVIVDMKQLTAGRRGCYGGGAEGVPKGPYCRQPRRERTTQTHREQSIVCVSARPSCSPFSLPHLSPSLTHHPPLALCVRGEHIGGRGKQLCLAVINPQDVIHKLLTINSLSVYKCG